MGNLKWGITGRALNVPTGAITARHQIVDGPSFGVDPLFANQLGLGAGFIQGGPFGGHEALVGAF